MVFVPVHTLLAKLSTHIWTLFLSLSLSLRVVVVGGVNDDDGACVSLNGSFV